jgi:hypothetical protein
MSISWSCVWSRREAKIPGKVLSEADTVVQRIAEHSLFLRLDSLFFETFSLLISVGN